MNKFFMLKDVDSHRIITFLGITIKFKIKKQHNKRTVEKYGLDTKTRNKKIIASLTTFPARINKVHITIENLLTQTVKPDKLILWLCEKEFPNKESDLPQSLLRLKEYGLSIEWCEFMRSYQKLVPTLVNYPDDIIITFDDDFYYPEDIIETLYFSYLKNPDAIHANRAWRYSGIKDDKLIFCSNNNMFHTKYNDISYKNLLMGYGGVLYPPNSLSKQFSDRETFMKLIPTHDDVWFWAMAVLGKTKIKTVKGYDFSIETIEDTQTIALSKKNKKGDSEGMDTQDAYHKIIKTMPEIMETLKKEN